MNPSVTVRVEGSFGRLRLSRPSVIHALDLGMCVAMTEALLAWSLDPAVEGVMLDHAQGRGFCAGGDVVMLARSGAADGAEAREFFLREYRLNHLLFNYSKPTIAFMDGIMMGGGVGISQPCRYRIATENTRFAMPETAIGLFPDVGGGWYLSRLPGRTGQYLALTGARLDGAECLHLGLATHYVPSVVLDDLKARILSDPANLATILEESSAPAPEAKIASIRESIDHLFASEHYEEILAKLEEDRSSWAQGELATLRSKSPLACKVSLRMLYEGRRMQDFAHEMRQEYAVAGRAVQRSDFVEGVRALLVDKDNQPRWDPPTAGEVSEWMVDTLFAPLPPGEDWTPL